MRISVALISPGVDFRGLVNEDTGVQFRIYGPRSTEALANPGQSSLPLIPGHSWVSGVGLVPEGAVGDLASGLGIRLSLCNRAKGKGKPTRAWATMMDCGNATIVRRLHKQIWYADWLYRLLLHSSELPPKGRHMAVGVVPTSSQTELEITASVGQWLETTYSAMLLGPLILPPIRRRWPKLVGELLGD